jgi:nucleoid-associated protein YgaU
MVRELIDTAKKAFAKTLPGHPDTGYDDSVDLLDQIKSLKAENDNLRSQLAQQHPTGVSLQNPPPITNFSQTPSLATTTTRRLSSPPAPPPVTPVTAVPVTPAAPTPTQASPIPHTYTVVAGDTLSNISLKVYDTKSRWPDILNANHDQLPSEKSPLHVGMVLKIP